MLLTAPPTPVTPSRRKGRPQGPPRVGLRPLRVLALLVALGALALFGYYVSLPTAAVVYCIGYMLLTWIRPELALFLMFASAPFPYDLGGGPVKMALAEINLVLAAPVLFVRALAGRRRFVRNPIKWPVLAYFGVCIVSSAIHGITQEGIVSMGQMVLYMILAVFVFSSCVGELRLFYAAFYGLLFSTAVLAMLAHESSRLGIHKNNIGTNLAYAVIVCGEVWFAEPVRNRKRLLTLLGCLLIAGLVFSLSRGAWVGAAAGLAVIAVMRRELKLLVPYAVLAAIVIAVCWQLLPKSDQEYATALGAGAYNVKTRLISIDYAMGYVKANPLLGVGVGLRKQYDATNVIMSTLAETGVVGLAAFLLIFVTFGIAIWKACRRVATGDPLFSLLAIGLALMICQFLHGCVDHYWTRVLLVPWGCLGMALYARQLAQRRSIQRSG